MLEKSNRGKIICGRRGRGIIGKLAQDWNRVLITLK